MENKLLIVVDDLDLKLGDIKNTGYYIRKNLLKLINNDNVLAYENKKLYTLKKINNIQYFPYNNRCDNIIEIIDKLNHVNLSYNKNNIISCMNWFNFVDKDLLNRKIIITKKDNFFKDVLDLIVDDNVFVKTVNKSIGSKVYNLNDNYSLIGLKMFLNAIDKDESIFISQPIQMLKDDLGNIEYRCLVTNKGKVSSISRRFYDYYKETTKKEIDKIIEFAKKIYCKDFSYCSIDIGVDINSKPFLVEINPIITTGLYFYNNLIKLVNENS